MNALRFSETSAIKYQSTRRYNPEDFKKSVKTSNLARSLIFYPEKLGVWLATIIIIYFLLQFGYQNLNLSKL